VNVFSVVERLSGAKGGPIQFDAERCLRSGDRLSACSACRDLCPASAIQWNAAAGKPPALLEDICTACRACLPACPVSAFSAADDAVAELLACAARAPSSSFDLLCEHHPRPATGPARDVLGLRVRGCLAGLGVGAYLALAAQGAERMLVRAESCGACPWAVLQPRVTQQVAQAQQLLAATGRAAALTAQTEPLAAPVARPIQNTQSPPLSRRDVWRQLARQGRTAVAQAWPVTEKAGTPAARKPGLDRRRINQAMGRLGDLSPRPPSLNGKGEQENSTASLIGTVEQGGVRPAIGGALGPGWLNLTASAACSACGVCARACRTGALRLDRDAANHYSLRFIPRSCVGCDACLHVCLPGALTADHAPAIDLVYGPAAVFTLAAGELVQCERCHAPMAARPGEKLCAACARWQRDPFGARQTATLRRAPDPNQTPEQPA